MNKYINLLLILIFKLIMLILNKMSKINLRILFVFALFLAFPFFAKAAKCDENTIVNVTARDPNGSFISKASVDIYLQTLDVDGNKKPGKRMAGGTTDAILGKATLTFRNSEASSETYAIRIRTIGKDSASFWYYDNALSCGQTASISETLSGILVALHKTNGDALTNATFNIYTQLYDTNGSLLNEKNELLSSFNSGTSGQVRVYVPQGSVRSIDGSLKDFYVLEVVRSGVKSYEYGIQVFEGSMTNIEYYLSSLRVRLKYASGNSAVGTQMEVYTQKVNNNNENQIDLKIGNFTIASNGYGSIEVSPGNYALRAKTAGVYQYFWDITAFKGKTTEHLLNLTGSSASTTSSTLCASSSPVNLILRDIAGNVAPGLKFEIYEQTTDANGLPTPGTKMVSGTTDSTGRAAVSFKPDSSKTYALKIWDKKIDLGDFWFFGALKFVCGYERNLTKNLPSLKIILRDAQGTPKYNYAFSLYAQRYDVDNKPTYGASDLVASLKTGTDGEAMVYVSPFNTYHDNQTGSYVISAKDANNNVKNFYNIKISEDKDYVFDTTFSGLGGEYRDAGGRLFANKNLDLYEQKKSGTTLSLGKKLLSFRANDSGAFQFEYPAGNYAIATTDDLNRQNIFWNVKVDSTRNFQKLTAGLTNFILTDPTNKNIGANPALQLFALSGSKGTYSRGSQISTIKLTNNKAALSLAPGVYLATYTDTAKQIFGSAFYTKNGHAYDVNIELSPKFLTANKKSFSLPGADISTTGTTGTPTNTTTNSSSRLNGRILLQVQDKGQAWYVNPVDGKRYSLGQPQDAYNVMRRLALGVSNSDFAAIENNPSAWKRLAGRILLKTQDDGRAYYFDPTNYLLYYLGRPQDAFNVMRTRGLGITNSDLDKINNDN